VAANAAAEEARETEPGPRAQLASIAADADPDRLWTGAVPAAQAKAQLTRAHRETFKFFFGSRVGLLRDMIRQQEAETAGRERSVKDLTGMWVAWRTKGYTGRTQTAGFETADRAAVKAEALKVYARYFPKDAEARAAFDRFLDRVDAYVPLRRPSNYRKLAFGVFYEAPTLPPEALKAKIDSSLSEAHLADIARWRAERQDAVAASFKAAALQSIREMNRVLPEGKKIVALILLGSYAIGQSTPNSDVDFQLVTQDGSPDAIAPFKEALQRNWTENRLDKLEAFQFALPPSPEVVRDSFPEGYLVVSPDPRAVEALTFETAPRAPSAWTRLRGKAFEWAYAAWIRAWFLAAAVRERLS
jgi:predicted nucleotidyltransferase